ncbi:MAG: hypothetical protein IKC31_03805 [Clostridia bacterium]|nr:hypothetical protein [Clostridia bacterium]
MGIYRVAFIGHRIFYELRACEEILDDFLPTILRQYPFVEFYVGRNGDFDIFIASYIKHLQKVYGDDNNTLNLVLPYYIKDMEYYEKYYDQIILPIPDRTHVKAAITKRNEWMVDQCDLLIAYVENHTGGAFQTVKYASRQNKPILNLATMIKK